MKRLLILSFMGLCFPTFIAAQSLEYAEDLYRHGLSAEASRAFLDILHDSNADANLKSEALYYLGEISLDGGRTDVALEDWGRLVEEYPTMPRAIEMAGRLAQLREVVGDYTDQTATSVVARSYLRNGDFWSDIGERFTIDSSWMPDVELAVEWYDRILAEFPGTDAAEIAHRQKVLTLIGWEDPGTYGSSYGARADFDRFIPLVIQAYEQLELQFPESRFVDPLRYQIAQAYWREKKWNETRTWLNRIITAAGDEETFYVQVARARLNKVEY